jgi:hypothetical protein
MLGGHPQAISLAAPLLEYKSLRELFHAFCDSNVLDALEYPQNSKDANTSLRVSLELSINHMKNTVPEALDLFAFIGYLPGGVTENELNHMWGSKEWCNLKDALIRASLLVYKTGYNNTFVYSMLPFMTIRACELLENDEEKKTSYHLKCCKLYKNYQYDFFISDRSKDQFDKLVEMETNIWACINRALNRKRDIEYKNEYNDDYDDKYTSDNEK